MSPDLNHLNLLINEKGLGGNWLNGPAHGIFPALEKIKYLTSGAYSSAPLLNPKGYGTVGYAVNGSPCTT